MTSVIALAAADEHRPPEALGLKAVAFFKPRHGGGWMIDQVTNLLHRYCHAVDRGTSEDVLHLFAIDATLVMDEHEAVGHDAIGTFYDGYFALCEETAEWVRHRLTSPFVHLGDDGTAQCVSYADVQSLWKTGQVMNIVVMYEDIVERVGDTTEWRFRKRTQTTVGAFEVAHN